MTALEPYVEAKAVAEYLSVPLSWVRDKTRQEAIPYHALGRYKRYLLSEIDARAAKQKKGAA